MIVLAYLWLLALVPLFAAREDPDIQWHAKHGIVLMAAEVLALVAYIVLLLSLTVHEAAHAWAALRGGDPTAYLGGQVSLDPRPHIRREPFGMVFAPLLFWFMGGWMVGWASTPLDPRWAYVHPRRAAAMAAAGPLANLALVFVGGVLLRIGVELGWFVPQPIQNRSCYRVFWGRYASREAAQQALASIPASLRDRSSAVKPVPKQ